MANDGMSCLQLHCYKVCLLVHFSFFFFFFMATPAAYGSSQARGPIRPATASLHHSLKQQRILNPLNKARDQNGVLMDTGRVCYH